MWFCHVPVGGKSSNFLSSLSKAMNLSKVCSNHSIRATGASILSKCMYGPSQVMSVTGHKILGVYQRVMMQKIFRWASQSTIFHQHSSFQRYKVPIGMIFWFVLHLHQQFVKLRLWNFMRSYWMADVSTLYRFWVTESNRKAHNCISMLECKYHVQIRKLSQVIQEKLTCNIGILDISADG